MQDARIRQSTVDAREMGQNVHRLCQFMGFEPSHLRWTVPMVGSDREPETCQDRVRPHSIDGVYPAGALFFD